MEERLVFLIGPPRSGSTLLTRMMGAHPKIHAPAEPHLLTPLAHLGYYESVEKAPYDPVIARAAIREVVADLPMGEADYLDSLRAYTDALYEKLLAPTGRELLLDKTPAYSLILDFAAKLYPKAKFVVLTRHPLAIWSSFVSSFFDGDHEVAHNHNPLIERYVPAIARFLRERPVDLHHVGYEQLVSDPEAHMESLCAYLGIDYEPGMVNYGDQPASTGPAARGLGDPMKVEKESRPTTASLAKWAKDLTGRPDKITQCQEILASLLDEDLETWGFSRAQIAAELDAVDLGGTPAKPPKTTRHTLERKVLVMLRRNIHHNAFGRLVRQARGVCDVLLR
ncbi:MAG: sulfotransferase [bacterium]|nr:sulfotransferase [bacterium]MCP5041504.1 sulfotransferase [bacterium]